MNKPRFFEEVKDYYIYGLLIDRLGLDVKDLTLLSVNPDKNYRQFFIKIKQPKSLFYKKAIGSFDNLTLDLEILSKGQEHYHSEKAWQKCMHKCCGEKYYKWHEDDIDKKIIELKQKDEHITVGKYTKNIKKAKELKESIKIEIEKLEDSRLIIAGKTRQTLEM